MTWASMKPISISATEGKKKQKTYRSVSNQEIGIGPLEIEHRDNWGVWLSDRCHCGRARHTPLALWDGADRAHSNRACPRSRRHVIGSDRLFIDEDSSVIGPDPAVNHKGSRGILPLLSEERLDELCETCHSKAVFSLRSHQIFTMLSYSRLAVWQKCIMWTRCGWHGSIGSCNNRVHSKIETNQMLPAGDKQLKASDIGFICSTELSQRGNTQAGFQKMVF